MSSSSSSPRMSGEVKLLSSLNLAVFFLLAKTRSLPRRRNLSDEVKFPPSLHFFLQINFVIEITISTPKFQGLCFLGEVKSPIDMLLSTSWENCHAIQNTPLLLQDPERPLNHISNGWIQEIEHLVLPLRRPRTIPKFWFMVRASLERGKTPFSAQITRVHKIIFSYKILINKCK